jgi:hypothetical protein
VYRAAPTFVEQADRRHETTTRSAAASDTSETGFALILSVEERALGQLADAAKVKNQWSAGPGDRTRSSCPGRPNQRRHRPGRLVAPGHCRSDAAVAIHAGAALIPASSGKTVRCRLNRSGNRQLHRALHNIACPPALRPRDPQVRRRLRAQGKTDREIKR